MEKLVTVVIPCYNDGIYIQQAVDSILNQTFKDFKIIIIDDGSGQQTKDILKQYNDERITIIFQENQGVSCARNNAIKLTNSKYILTLDADDYFEAIFLEKAIKILEKDERVAVVGCYYNLVKNNIVKKVIKPSGGGVENFLIKNNGLGNALFRKKCWDEVGGYDENMHKGYEDWEFWIAILSKGWKMKIIEETLFNYRIKTESRDQIAVEQHDLILKKYIFTKHKVEFEIHFEKMILSLYDENDKYRKSYNRLMKSLDYKLGKLIIKPLKYIKRIIYKS